MKKFWSLKKTASNVGELLLYGEIANSSWWGDEVTPKQLADDLKSLGQVDEINVRINSPGGDVFAGVAIHTMLTRHGAKINVFVDGLAASIASIVAMAGETITMAKGTMMMIHNPWSFAVGTAADMRQRADLLDNIRDSMLTIYTARTGKASEEIIPLLDAETWFSAEDAITNGFADSIEEGLAVSACLRGKTAIFNGVEADWTKFRNAPKLPEATPEPAGRNLDLELKLLALSNTNSFKE